VSMALMIILMVFFRMGLHLYHFFIYRGSIDRLPFAVNGWSSLVNRKTIEWQLVWHTVTIKIDLGSDNPREAHAVQAALQIFFRKAKKKFYTPEILGIDPRN